MALREDRSVPHRPRGRQTRAITRRPPSTSDAPTRTILPERQNQWAPLDSPFPAGGDQYHRPYLDSHCPP